MDNNIKVVLTLLKMQLEEKIIEVEKEMPPETAIFVGEGKGKYFPVLKPLYDYINKLNTLIGSLTQEQK